MGFLRPAVAAAALALLSGCSYIHFGRLPDAPATGGDATMAEAYTNLLTEQKMLKQELALARKEGDALRTALDHGGGAPAADTAGQLNETARELATLRANYARLQAERAAAAPAAESPQLTAENARLRADLDQAHAENASLADKLKAAVTQNEQTQVALAQLNTELLAEKEARNRAEQATTAAHAQLSAVMAQAAPGAPTAELRTKADRIQNSGTPRIHVVAAGDTLESIAQSYYGDSRRWTRIYAANLDLLRDGKPITPGMKLEIPD